MVYIYLKGGDCVEVEAAVKASLEADNVLCFDAEGIEIASFPKDAVVSYTNDPKIIDAVFEEICDQPTVIPA